MRNATAMAHILKRVQLLPTDLDTAWKFFSSPRNLDEITPDDLKFEIVHLDSEVMFPGQMIHYRIQIFPGIWNTWVTEITLVENKVRFVDNQCVGPYALWHHEHRFEACDGGVRMTDEVHYHIGFGIFGEIAHSLFVKKMLKNIFDHRTKVIGEHFSNAAKS